MRIVGRDSRNNPDEKAENAKVATSRSTSNVALSLHKAPEHSALGWVACLPAWVRSSMRGRQRKRAQANYNVTYLMNEFVKAAIGHNIVHASRQVSCYTATFMAATHVCRAFGLGILTPSPKDGASVGEDSKHEDEGCGVQGSSADP